MKVYRHTKAHAGIVPAEDFTVECMEIADHGQPEAIIEINGELIQVTRRFGSWGTEPDDRGTWRPLTNEYAAALQLAAHKIETRETTCPLRDSLCPAPRFTDNSKEN